jgi:cell division protein FtsQ
VLHPGPGDAATRAALAAVVALPAGVHDRVSGVRATTGQDVTLQLRDGTTVVWGDGGSARAKAAALQGLLDHIADRSLAKAGTIDVSTPGAVVLR